VIGRLAMADVPHDRGTSGPCASGRTGGARLSGSCRRWSIRESAARRPTAPTVPILAYSEHRYEYPRNDPAPYQLCPRNPARRSPAVALIGPRQVGKTTLALALAAQRPSVYLDLESEADRAKLAEPELYFARHEDKLVVLDEVHRAPDLFRVLRGVIDQGRRTG
jgi:hypothetical protein